ncbi:MAG: NYN domain-containing protein, partial [Solobacterium sp.]|nr:NYN domain-containing protein [Solobacterium sp.]
IDIHIMGEMQMEVLQKRIFDRCGISVGFSTGRILYRETIKETVKGAGHFEPLRHYAEVQVRLDPLERGKGIVIASETGSDQLSFNWQNTILSALRTKKHRGVLTGSELTDVKITLIAGKGHLKHTEGGDFRQAASRAVRQALMKTSSILLEPYVSFELTVPSDSLSKALFDLESKKTQFEIQDSKDGRSVIVGRGCIRLLAHYQNEVSAYSKGQGRFSFQPDGYDVCQDTDEIVAQIGYDPEMDMRNPSSSVFCANGSGFTVTWDKADEYMDIAQEKVESVSTQHRTYRIEEDELKRIFDRSTSNNRNFNKQHNPVKKKPKEEKPKVMKHLPPCLIVDGYNMIFSWDIFKEYKDDELEISREKLLDILFNYQAFTGEKMIVVFDGYKVKDNLGTIYSRKDMEVVYTSSNLTADAYIERFVADHQKEYDLTVVSSDSLIQNAIFAHGAKRMSARELFGRITFINQEIEEQLAHS